MRLMLPFVMLLAMLLLSEADAAAAPREECLKQCADEKTSADAACADMDASFDQSRFQCLQKSQNDYAACLNKCPAQAAPAQPSDEAPAEPQPAPEETPPEN